MFGRKKKFVFYAVKNTDDMNQILTLTETKDQAMEFGYKYLRMKHFDHFKMWCELRNLDVTDIESWDSYFVTVLPYEEKAKYVIIKKIYTHDEMAAFMRMFLRCAPIGCDYENDQELLYFQQLMYSQEIASNLMKSDLADRLKEMIDKELEKEQDNDGK